jgi:predicted amidohydrolase YtcJ
MEKIKPNLVLKNGAVYTVDKLRSWAQAVAIEDHKFVIVGSNADVESCIGPDTVVIDLKGKMVLPGFVDAHAHPSQAMDFFGNINLYSLDTLGKYQKEITQYVENHPEKAMYRGSGWSDSLFTINGPPKEILDAILPDRPICLISYDGHSLWVNSASLEIAQITIDTPNPDGGIIEHDPDTGEPNGTLREAAASLVEHVFPDYSTEERVSALLAYQDMAVRAGVTMTHDAMLDMPSIAAFKQLEEDGLFGMRFRGAITIRPGLPTGEQISSVIEQRSINKHPRFQTNTAKIFVDGVVEGGTAYLLEPYQHKPEFSGIPIWDPDLLKDTLTALDEENIQIHVHVIGDAAASMTLDALEYAQGINGKRDSRHLLTHLQLVASGDISRFNQLGVIGVPNPYWFKIDGYYHTLALPYLGAERADKQYPMKSFLDAGVAMASASDFPVTIPFDPLIGIQIGITRSEVGVTSPEVLWPDERVNLEQMITSFTYNGAYANFLENQIGSLEVGKQADFIVLDHNLFEIPLAEIADIKVLLTYVDGQEVFRSAEFS